MIYLDAAATAQVRREALEAMWPFLGPRFGNPSSVHELGRDAEVALEDARASIARVLGARPSEVTMTSGGTESDNTAVKGIALARAEAVGARHVIVSAVEHTAVLESANWLGRFGFEVSVLGVDRFGMVGPAELERVLRADTAVVSVQLANNEVGTVQPVADLAAICAAVGVPLHTDAVQAAGWLSLDVEAVGVSALALAAQKVGGPRGVGALWVKRGVPLEPLLHGGGQERGRRSGTQDVAGAVGFATALTLAESERLTRDGGRVPHDGGRVPHDGGRVTHDGGRVPHDGGRLAPPSPLRDAFIARVVAGLTPLLPEVALTGHPTDRLGGHASFVLGGVSGESVLLELERRGVISSSGSACHAGSDEPSHVLTAMGIERELAQTSLRFTWAASINPADLDLAADALISSVVGIIGASYS